MKVLFFVFFLLIPNLLFAQWTEQSLKVIDNSSKTYGYMQDEVITTLWGGFKRFWRINKFTGEEIDIPTKKFKSGKLPVYLRKTNKKAPLLVLLPGIFGKYNGQITPKNIEDLEVLDFHLVVPPNFLAPKYIENIPLYDNDPSRFDIDVAIEMIEKSIEIIGSDKISKIHLVGESLGTLVASGIYAVDTQRANSLLKDGSITLLWPPVDLKNSLKSFDKRIKDSEKIQNDCFYFYNLLPGIIYHFIYQEKPDDFGKDFKHCIKPFLYHEAFMRTAKKSFDIYKENKEEVVSIEPKNFSEFFQYYQPIFHKMLEDKDPRTELSYWLRQGRKQNLIPLRIISSKDDFINDGVKWEQFKEDLKLSDDQLL